MTILARPTTHPSSLVAVPEIRLRHVRGVDPSIAGTASAGGAAGRADDRIEALGPDEVGR